MPRLTATRDRAAGGTARRWPARGPSRSTSTWPRAPQRAIPIFYAPGRNARAVAEFTVGLIIAELRDIGRGHAALSQGIWRAELYLHDTAPRELNGQTVGLIGFGNIGRMMPKYLLPFGMRVLAYDPYVDDEVFVRYGAERVRTMDDLLAQS